MPYRILVIDDETGIREAIRMTLEYEGYRIDEARSGQEGLDKATKTPYDAILLDIKMPFLDGIEVLDNLKEQRVNSPVVMVSGHGDVHTAVECTKRGAFDFLEKPLNRDKLLLTVRNAVRQRSLEEENTDLKEKVEKGYQLVGDSQVMRDLKSQIERAAPTKATVRKRCGWKRPSASLLLSPAATIHVPAAAERNTRAAAAAPRKRFRAGRGLLRRKMLFRRRKGEARPLLF